MFTRRSRFAAGVMMVCLTAFAAGCSLLPAEDEGLAPPLVEPVQEKLQIYTVERGTIVKRIKGSAVIEPVSMKYHLFEPPGGQVLQVNVKAGDEVRQGDVLMVLRADGIEIKLKQAELEVEKKKKAFNSAKLTRDPEEMKIPLLELQLAELQWAEVRRQQEGARLRAEMDGMIVFVEELKAGDIVQPYRTVATIADPSAYRLFYQPSNTGELKDAEVGMQAIITYAGQQVTGTVVQTPSTAPFTNDQRLADEYARRLYIQPDAALKDAEFGKFADIEITLSERKDVIIIPKGALRTYSGRKYVQLLDGESRIEADVQIGLVTDTQVEVINGLEAGQQVIL